MSVFVIVVSVVFVRLGFWQLDRRLERQEEITVVAARLGEPPLPLEEMIRGTGAEVDSLEFRHALVVGRFRPDLEVLVRNRTNRFGTAGFHVLTPIELDDGSLVIVNRGWVRLEEDTVPVSPLPPSGRVEVPGLIRMSQKRSAVGPIDPPGDLDIVNRIDLDRLAQMYDHPLVPVWIQAEEPIPAGGPDPLEPPEISDPGPHLSYAIQWFSFAAISVFGYLIVLRRKNCVSGPVGIRWGWRDRR